MQRSGSGTSRQREQWLQSPEMDEFLFGAFEFSVGQKSDLAGML